MTKQVKIPCDARSCVAALWWAWICGSFGIFQNKWRQFLVCPSRAYLEQEIAMRSRSRYWSLFLALLVAVIFREHFSENKQIPSINMIFIHLNFDCLRIEVFNRRKQRAPGLTSRCDRVNSGRGNNNGRRRRMLTGYENLLWMGVWMTQLALYSKKKSASRDFFVFILKTRNLRPKPNNNEKASRDVNEKTFFYNFRKSYKRSLAAFFFFMAVRLNCVGEFFYIRFLCSFMNRAEWWKIAQKVKEISVQKKTFFWGE